MTRQEYIDAIAPLLDHSAAVYQASVLQNVADLTESQRVLRSERNAPYFDLQYHLSKALRAATQLPEASR